MHREALEAARKDNAENVRKSNEKILELEREHARDRETSLRSTLVLEQKSKDLSRRLARAEERWKEREDELLMELRRERDLTREVFFIHVEYKRAVYCTHK